MSKVIKISKCGECKHYYKTIRGTFCCGKTWTPINHELDLNADCPLPNDATSDLESEVKRLRDALKNIVGNGDATGCNPQIFCDLASEALKGATP